MTSSLCGIPLPSEKNERETQAITHVMFPAYPEDRIADLGVVLGAGIVSLPMLLKGVDLLKKGQVGHLLLSGGAIINDLPETKMFAPLLEGTGLPMPNDGEREADYMARFLKTLGVPETAYTIENRSQNTGENFRNCMQKQVYQKASSINIIGLLPTRALMTLRKEEDNANLKTLREIPLNTIIGKSADDLSAQLDFKIALLTNVIPLPGVGPKTWNQHPMAATFVRAEFAKIDPRNEQNYITQGHIKDIDLEREIQLVERTLPIKRPQPPQTRTSPQNNR